MVRHPVLSEDEAVKFFLTAGGNEVGARIKDRFKSALEEYNTHPQAETAEASPLSVITRASSWNFDLSISCDRVLSRATECIEID